MKNFDVNCPPRGLVLGYAGENVARGQAFDFTAWAEEYGAGSLQVVLQRPGDAAPYPVALTVEGTVATWLPTETDLQEAGTGQLQLIYTVGTVRVKTLIVSVLIGPSLGSSSEAPAPGQAWIDQLTDLAAETEQNAASAAQSAENAAASATGAQRSATDAENAKTAAVAAAGAAAASASHYPQIVGGVWYVWSPTAGEYISTGIDAQGEDGVSPTVEITAIQGGHRVVITDAAGQHTFDVLDGVTPDMSAYRTAVEQDVIDDAQDEELNNLKSALNTKAGILRDTVSGSVASFVPDATIDNLLGLSVALEPIQDLHGYDSPWPAVGGKNILPTSLSYIKANHQYGTWDGNNYIFRGITWTIQVDEADNVTGIIVNGTATQETSIIIGPPIALDGEYILNGCPAGGNGSSTFNARLIEYPSGNVVKSDYGTTATAFTSTETVRGRITIYGGYTANNLTFKPMLRLSSVSDASFAPYSNICPISGRESVEVEATGINVWDEEWEIGSINTQTGQNAVSSTDIRSKNYIAVKPGSTIYRSWDTAQSGSVYTLWMTYKADKSFSRYIAALINPAPLVLNDDEYYLRFYAYGRTTEIPQMMINYGTAAMEYKPYSGNRYTIQLGDTVYGGTLTIAEDGSVTALVDRAKTTVGALSWSLYNTAFYASVQMGTTERPISPQYKSEPSVSSMGDASGWSDYSIRAHTSGTYVYVKDTRYSTAAAFKTAEADTEIVYELATPITIQLDPVTIAAIAGQTNNVWADAGDVTVEYAADLKHYIDSKIAAAVAALS